MTLTKQFSETEELNRKRRSAFHPGQESYTPLKVEYICADRKRDALAVLTVC